MIHVALVNAYPTEAAARAGLAEDHGAEPAEQYRGIWRAPQPYLGICHLFSDDATEKLTRAGWTLVSSALPGDADASFLLDREDA